LTSPVGAESVGRVWIRTRSRMAGYWEAPGATEKVVREEWLDSGDLARADEDGYLWFFGRKKQVIVHDAVHGENVRAYVTLREGAERPSSADLIVFCRDRVGYKAPEEVVFLEEMPLNPTGKIDRVGLKRMAEDHLHPHGLE
jgi:long-chain acyl-CoA synthetase